MEVQPDHSLKQLKVWSDVAPYWLGKPDCDLPKSRGLHAVHAVQSSEKQVSIEAAWAAARSRAAAYRRAR